MARALSNFCTTGARLSETEADAEDQEITTCLFSRVMKFAPSHCSLLLSRFVFHKVEASDWWWTARNRGKDTLPLTSLSRLWIRGRSHRLSLVFYSHSWPKNFWVLNGWWNFLKVKFSLNSSESRKVFVPQPCTHLSRNLSRWSRGLGLPAFNDRANTGTQNWTPDFFCHLRVNLKVVFVGGKIFCTLWSFKLIMSLLSFSVWTL